MSIEIAVMAKIPFTLDAWLKDKSQNVETRDGRTARIICTDAKADDGACIIALIPGYGGEEAYQFFPDGRAFSSKSSDEDCTDLFIITPEQELTNWEKFISGCLQKHGLLDCGAADRIAKESAAELLELAEKELEEEVPEMEFTPIENTLEYKAGFRVGKAEVLKDLPRWIHDGFVGWAIDISGLWGSDFIRRNGKLLQISSLEKLPGFKED